MRATRSLAIVLCIVMGSAAVDAYAAPPAAFTYQGQLKYRDLPVSGEARFVFTLWDAELEGRQVSGPVDARLVIVNGLFTAPLDFGPEAFNGEPRWLEIMVASEQGEGRLTPRQPVTPTPVALFALNGNAGPRGPAGSDGAAGANGMACWDLNGDGVQDRIEDINTDGAFDTLDCQGDGGSGGLTLPYAGTNTSDETAFGIANSGLGGAAAFISLNPANTAATLGVSTYGSGPGVMAVATGGGHAIVGATGSAGGNAGWFSVVGTTATQTALEAFNAALGSAAHFETANTDNTSSVLVVETSSDGTAGEFTINKPLSRADALSASTNGLGRAGFFEVAHLGPRTVPALEAISDSNQGGAGLFKTTSTLNTAAALVAEAAGNADAIRGVAKGSGAAVMGYNAFGGNAIVGTVDGNAGRAGSFRSIDSTNPNPTLEAVRSGSGSAGRFENTSSTGLAGEFVGDVSVSGDFVGDVSVTGAVEANSYQHRTPRTHYLSLNAFDFEPNARGLRWERQRGPSSVGAMVHSDSGKKNHLGAPVHLPHGAVVTGVQVFYSTDANFDFPLKAVLYRRIMWNGGDIPMATMITPDQNTAGLHSMATTSIGDATINNSTSTYWVHAGLELICQDAQIGCSPAPIQGVRISYTKEID